MYATCPANTKNKTMKDKFDSLVDHLMGSNFFLKDSLELLERTLIERALARTDGRKQAAAKLLGIHRNTLQRKMVEYKLEPEAPRRKAVRRAPMPPRGRAKVS